jgi:hypothetical protein
MWREGALTGSVTYAMTHSAAQIVSFLCFLSRIHCGDKPLKSALPRSCASLRSDVQKHIRRLLAWGWGLGPGTDRFLRAHNEYVVNDNDCTYKFPVRRVGVYVDHLVNSFCHGFTYLCTTITN